MIILTSQQAAQVRGPTSNNAMLDPRLMLVGTYALPEAVLTDPDHAARWPFLNSLPRLNLTVADFPVVPV